MKKTQQEPQIIISKIEEGTINAVLVGKTPLILNKMSEKAKHELLMPRGRKTGAERAANLKHDVIVEYRASAHTVPDGPTLLAFPASGPKKAMASAALDIPGAKKAQIGRLAWVVGEYVSVFGTPKLHMSITRSADVKKTPDVRSRVIVREWAIPISVRFAMPILTPTVIINLLSAAGLYVGLGDWRNEKGANTYGQFSVMGEEQARGDERVQRILQQGREVQIEALNNPEPYDAETLDLFTWYQEQLKVRGKKQSAAA